MVKKNVAMEGRHVYITAEMVSRGDKTQYESLVVLPASRLEF